MPQFDEIQSGLPPFISARLVRCCEEAELRLRAARRAIEPLAQRQPLVSAPDDLLYAARTALRPAVRVARALHAPPLLPLRSTLTLSGLPRASLWPRRSSRASARPIMVMAMTGRAGPSLTGCASPCPTPLARTTRPTPELGAARLWARATPQPQSRTAPACLARPAISAPLTPIPCSHVSPSFPRSAGR